MEIPRRARRDMHTPVERAITTAMRTVEALRADVRLTSAVVLLATARDLVADFVDGVNPTRTVTPVEPQEYELLHAAYRLCKAQDENTAYQLLPEAQLDEAKSARMSERVIESRRAFHAAQEAAGRRQ